MTDLNQPTKTDDANRHCSASSGSKSDDPWHDLMCNLDEIRHYLHDQGRIDNALVIGDVQSRLTKQKETIAAIASI